MKKLLALIPLFVVAQAHANVITFSLDDIGAFSGLRNTNTSSTYAGTGYLGMYANAWGHVLGLERSNLSRTIMQVDIGALAGKLISSAVLTFDLKEGEPGTQTATLVGYDADVGAGELAYKWNAPTANYGSITATMTGRSTNNFAITALLAASVAEHDSWFGMHLKGSTLPQWTVANNGNYAANRAHMYLTVDYLDAVAVPEPGSLLLVSAGMLAAATLRRRRALLGRSANLADARE